MKYIWIFGSSILLLLGTIHLVYTFFTDKFSSRNEQVVKEMRTSFPILTNETTMWKAWIGFNASHSSGAMFIGIINIYLACNYYSQLDHDLIFHSINIITVGFYLWLAKRFWFTVPFYGILLSMLCFLTIIFLALLNGVN